MARARRRAMGRSSRRRCGAAHTTARRRRSARARTAEALPARFPPTATRASYVYPVNSTGPAPGSQASLREMNRLRVLDAVREHGALTQVEIAGVTGLSAATVSNLVKELDAAGAVLLSPSIRNGRRAVQVSVAASHGLVAADRLRRPRRAGRARHRRRRDRQPEADAAARRPRGRRGHVPRGPARARARRTQSGHSVVGDPGRRRRAARPDRPRSPVRSAPRASCPDGGACPSPRRWRTRSAPRSSSTTPPTSPPWASSKFGALQGVSNGSLHQGVLRRRCRPHPRRRALPRQRGHGGRDRARDDRRGRPGLPVRQPRLPRHLRRVAGGARRPCATRTAR